jgi:hypothetical protein
MAAFRDDCTGSRPVFGNSGGSYNWRFKLRAKPAQKRSMPDTFDPYREALIMETETIWPAELATIPAATKARVSEQLHAAPDKCAVLNYVRVHTGFCRQITVTQADLDRVGIA